MNTKEFEALFEKHEDEFLKFDRVDPKRNRRADLNAFLLLDELSGGDKTFDMVSATMHDEIFLYPELEDIASVATEDNVIELIRCGVRIADGGECFCMFV